MRVLIDGAMSPHSGYGNDGIAMVRAMLADGWDVCLAPRDVAPPLPHEVALLLTKPPEGIFDLLLSHVDPGAAQPLTARSRDKFRRTVLWSMWEWPNLDRLDDVEGFQRAAETFDEVWAYDPVSVEAFASVGVVARQFQGGYPAEDWPEAVGRVWDDTFRFGMVGALHDRKNPFAAIRAFSALKDEHGDDFDAQLHLKTVTRTLHPGLEDRYPGVRVHYDLWPLDRLRAFYASLHAYVAPSRGEGKNLPALQALSSGIPVIAPAYGGHAVWSRSDWVYEVDYSLDDDGGCEVDEDDLAVKMLDAYMNRSKTREMGALAARSIPAMCSWGRVVRDIRQRVRTASRSVA